MFFVGEYARSINNDKLIYLPNKFYSELDIPEKIIDLGYPMLIAPINECIMMYSLNYLNNNLNTSWIETIDWMPDIKDLVRNNRIFPCYPYYKTDLISEKMNEVNKLIFSEIQSNRKSPRNISGKDFEKLLHDILLFCGINVQLNIHLLGGEIDLLLIEVNNNGKIEFTIIECKNRELSQGLIGINQVMRVYGLSEALKDNMCIKNSLIVSTTGFTRNAKQFAKTYNMNLCDFEGFLEWVDEHNLISNQNSCPVFRIVNIDKRKRFRIPSCLNSYINPSKKDIILIGVSNRIEIWEKDWWDHYIEFDSHIDGLSQRLEDLGI